MSNEIRATVHAVLPMESGTSQASGRSWARQTVVVKWIGGTEEYPKECFLALTNQTKAEEFGKLRVGDKIKAKYRVTSREYNGKWYHDVNCFAWELESAAAPAPASAPAAPSAPSAPAAPAAPAAAPAPAQQAAPAADPNSLEPQSDDLPFNQRPQ